MTVSYLKHIPSCKTDYRSKQNSHRLFARLMHFAYDDIYKVRLATIGALRVTQFNKKIDLYLKGLAKNNSVGLGQHPWRALDLISLCKRYRPKLIHELGSGTSTGIFSAYCEKYGAKLVTYEENQDWFEFNKKELLTAKLLGDHINYQYVEAEEEERGSCFTKAINSDSDLVYVDGPFCKSISAKERYPNLDIIHHLNDGYRPKVIVVDGRWQTVRALLEHPNIKDYDFIQSASAAATAFDYKSYLGLHHHCIFIKKVID